MAARASTAAAAAASMRVSGGVSRDGKTRMKQRRLEGTGGRGRGLVTGVPAAPPLSSPGRAPLGLPRGHYVVGRSQSQSMVAAVHRVVATCRESASLPLLLAVSCGGGKVVKRRPAASRASAASAGACAAASARKKRRASTLRSATVNPVASPFCRCSAVHPSILPLVNPVTSPFCRYSCSSAMRYAATTSTIRWWLHRSEGAA